MKAKDYNDVLIARMQGAKAVKRKAIYEDAVSRPLQKPDPPERAETSLTVSESFSHLLDELQDLEAKEDIDKTLKSMRRKKYYGYTRA